jgi:hypothetical protein
MSSIDALEIDFLAGKPDQLKNRRCPLCNGRLFFSIAHHNSIPDAPSGRRIRCGVNIYCLGNCNTMLSHLDGFCPSWAEEISDWKAYSSSLYE